MKKLYLCALAMVVACASQSGPNAPAGTVVARTDRNIISDAEIQSIPSANLYDLISKLRPNFLRSRGAVSLSSGTQASEFATVYMDGRPYGDITSLRSIVSTQVSEVRYYDSSNAASRFGTINGNGVIEVIIKQ
jgi:hypothetical protein